MSSLSMRTTAAVAIVSTLAMAQGAIAAVTVSDPFLMVTATQGSLTGSFIVPLSDPGIFAFSDPDIDFWDWAISTPTAITSGSTTLGVISANTGIQANRSSQPDGSVRWGINGAFNVTAGAAPTTFEIMFATLSFDPLNNAFVQASAGLVGTDQQQGTGPNPFDGISVTGAHTTGSSFQAILNGSTVFRDYLAGSYGNPNRGGSFNDDANMSPPGSFEQVPGVLTSISAKYRFTVSAFDNAAGTFDVTVLPAPGAAGLLGFGALVAMRRRR